MGEMRNAYEISVVKPEGKRPHERPRRRYEDHVRMVRREIEWEIVDWTRVVQDRDQWRTDVNTVMNLWVP
jgi:hypothetical protein